MIMNIEDILKLVNAGFTAEQIGKMAAESKALPTDTSPSVPPTPQTTVQEQEQKTEPAPAPSETKEEPKKEEPKKEEGPDLHAELAKANEQIAKLQGIRSNQNAGGSARPDTPEEYLKKIFQDMY